VSIAVEAPLGVIFAAFLVVGVSIGFVSTAGLTLIQSSSESDEMGRVNAAHQFLRTLAITYGVALGGAVLLWVVDRQVGDVEVVRSVLAGEDIDIAGETASAVQDGMVWVVAAAGVIGAGCLVAALALRRSTGDPVTI